MAETSRRNRVHLSILLVTIHPSKDTEKYIADNKAVRSNKKLLINKHLEDKRPRLRETDGLSLESLHKNKVYCILSFQNLLSVCKTCCYKGVSVGGWKITIQEGHSEGTIEGKRLPLGF